MKSSIISFSILLWIYFNCRPKNYVKYGSIVWPQNLCSYICRIKSRTTKIVASRKEERLLLIRLGHTNWCPPGWRCLLLAPWLYSKEGRGAGVRKGPQNRVRVKEKGYQAIGRMSDGPSLVGSSLSSINFRTPSILEFEVFRCCILSRNSTATNCSFSLHINT